MLTTSDPRDSPKRRGTKAWRHARPAHCVRRTQLLSRRDALCLFAGSVGSTWVSGCAAEAPNRPALPMLSKDRQWLAKLGEGLDSEFDYIADSEGKLPSTIEGTLYRNGPGLFERDGFKKWTVLDGDGMIRATTFVDGKARFRNRFVRTQKFEAEEKAGRFLYPTWTTPAPS